MENNEELHKKIREFALENALKFNGKANPGAIIGKLMSLDKSISSIMKDLQPIIKNTISEVNGLSIDDQKKELLLLNPSFEDEQKAKKIANKESRSDLPELQGAVIGHVKTRLAPEPSKYPHLGHAVSFLLNYMYAKKYNGTCLLRFDDTNPELSKEEYVQAIETDVLEYLGITVSQTIFASNEMDYLISLADSLVDKGLAYTSNQPSSSMSLYRREMKDHEDRNKSKDVVKKEWDLMKKGDSSFDDFVLRLKISMQHKNAVMRDPVIFRIIKTPHFKVGSKYAVWPMYDFECAILEGTFQITHVLRSNEFESRIELQDHIRKLFDLPCPFVKQYARTSVENASTKGREIRELIESNQFIGWDDPRLITLKALRRRGIVKESYYELAKVIGMSKTNSVLDFSVISSINRRLLDQSAKRFFCIIDPVSYSVASLPFESVSIKLHPHNDLGKRTLLLSKEIFLEKKDVASLEKEEEFRLIDAMNIKEGTVTSVSHSDFKGSKLFHYLPSLSSEIVPIEILMPDCTVVKGISEKAISSLSIGDVIQFVRFGFCRLDSIRDGTFIFWFTHD